MIETLVKEYGLTEEKATEVMARITAADEAIGARMKIRVAYALAKNGLDFCERVKGTYDDGTKTIEVWVDKNAYLIVKNAMYFDTDPKTAGFYDWAEVENHARKCIGEDWKKLF